SPVRSAARQARRWIVAAALDEPRACEARDCRGVARTVGARRRVRQSQEDQEKSRIGAIPMPTLLEILESNSVAAPVLAGCAFAAARWRRPAVAHGLWLLVLIKLVTPPLIPVHVPAWNWDFTAESVAQESAKTAPAKIPLEALSAEEIAMLLKLTEEAPEPA